MYAVRAAFFAPSAKAASAERLSATIPTSTGRFRPTSVAAATRAVAVRAEKLDPSLATTAYIRAERGGKVFLDSTRAWGATVVAAYSPRLPRGPADCR